MIYDKKEKSIAIRLPFIIFKKMQVSICQVRRKRSIREGEKQICGRISLRIETAFSFAQIIDFCSYKK